MRRVAIVGFLVGVAFAPAALAAPSPQLYDQAGDANLESQDVVSGRLSSFWSGRTPRLRGELKLLAAPAPGVASGYSLTFSVGCRAYTLVHEWTGGAPGATAALTLWDHCATRDPVRDEPDGTFPVTFAVKGTTLTWDAPYAGGLRRGQKVTGFSAAACTQICGLMVGSDPSQKMLSGDFAWSESTYVLGSDLPRR